MTKRITGQCVGVEIADRSPNDKHQTIALLIEDDEVWHKCGFLISSFWLDETIAKLQEAREHLERECDKTDWGWNRK